MIRMVKDPDGQVVFDVNSRLPGRGAWVCPDIACISKMRPSSLGHVLRAEIHVPDPPLLRDRMGSALESKCRNLLTIGRKAGQVVTGSQEVSDAHHQNRVELFLIACDASSRTVNRFQRLSGRVPVGRLASRDRLGRWLGKRPLATAAVLDRGLARRLETLLRRLAAIEYSPYHFSNEFSTQED
jgi:ribosomal protein L7Ae-like RNA K-turn-binding protein